MNANAEVRVIHDDLGTGWVHPGLRARGEHEACDLVQFTSGVWAYVPVRELHAFGVHPSYGGDL